MYLETSGKFNAAIRKDGRTFCARMTCGDECIESGFTSIGIYGGSNNADTITIGSTISQRIEVEMYETDIALSEKEWLLEIGLRVNGIMPSDEVYPCDSWFPGEAPEHLKELDVAFFEYVPIGYFTPEKPATDNGKTTFKAYDRMIKLSGGYVCTLSNVTSLTVLKDISLKTGVPIDTTGLKEIPIKRPEGYTCREVLMYIAQLYGKFANVNRKGVIEFHWWTMVDGYIITADDTNGFKHNETEFVLGYLYVANTEENTVSITVGEGKQGISIYNPFMTEVIAKEIYVHMNEFSYTTANVNYMLADIRLDPWDIVSVADIRGNTYDIPLMALEYKYDGGLSATLSAVGNSETEETVDFKGPMKLLQERLESKVSNTEQKLSTRIKQNAEEIELRAEKDKLIALINLSAEEAVIKATRIALEGIITANENFKIFQDGSMYSKNGTFEGTIKSSSADITGGNINIRGIAQGSFPINLNGDNGQLIKIGPYWTRMENSEYRTEITNGLISLGTMSGTLFSQNLRLWYDGDITTSGSLSVSGTKSRVAATKSYNKRMLYCYEMPSPIFGDVGHGVIGEDGLCYIDIDQIFFETVDMNQSYQVFLQSYSEHNVYVLKREPQYFIVKGEPYTEFDWELKAKQLEFPTERLEENFAEDDYVETNYVSSADEYLNKYEQEVLNYG